MRNSLLESSRDNLIQHEIITLQYVDDTIIFCSAKATHITSIKLFLYSFEMIYGLSINFHKSSVIMTSPLNDLGVTIVSALNCRLSSFPFTYPGLTIRPNKLSREDWIPLIDKISNRLSGWKWSSLSKGGRLVLVNSVLTALPTFWMFFYKLSDWVLSRIDRYRQNFLWSGSEINSPISCLVTWTSVCKPKAEGGLGVLNYKNFNNA